MYRCVALARKARWQQCTEPFPAVNDLRIRRHAFSCVQNRHCVTDSSRPKLMEFLEQIRLMQHISLTNSSTNSTVCHHNQTHKNTKLQLSRHSLCKSLYESRPHKSTQTMRRMDRIRRLSFNPIRRESSRIQDLRRSTSPVSAIHAHRSFLTTFTAL